MKVSDVIVAQDNEYKLAYFMVLARGPKATAFKVGSVVITNMYMASRNEITEYLNCDDGKYYVVKEKELYFGLDDDEKARVCKI